MAGERGLLLTNSSLEWLLTPKLLYSIRILSNKRLLIFFQPNQQKYHRWVAILPLYRFSETSVLFYSCVEFGAFGLSLQKSIYSIQNVTSQDLHTFCFILGAGWGGPNRWPGEQSFTNLKSGSPPKWSGEEGRDVLQGLYTGLFSKLVPWYITLDKEACQQRTHQKWVDSSFVPQLNLQRIAITWDRSLRKVWRHL